MNQGCNAAVFEHEVIAFELPTGLDRSPPRYIECPNTESRWLAHSIDARRLTAPVLALNASDVMLLPEPIDYTHAPSCGRSSNCSSRSTPRSRTKCSGGASSSTMSPKTHRHHSKKASRKQVHELQTMVNTMQMQVDGAATQIQHLAQLVGEFAHQRQQEQELYRRQQQVFFEEHEMDMDLGAQQQHLRAQVEHDREQFEREQREQQYDACRSPSSSSQEAITF